MCGIAGILDRNGSGAFLKDIVLMTSTLRHRGPDDEGIAFFGENHCTLLGGPDTPENVYRSQYPYSPDELFQGHVPDNSFLALGHRRLSILDLSPAGHQPMCNEDRTIWIIYNGEIYNFKGLRQELEACGHQFRSHADTEVILHAYEEWGEQCLDKFDGMWAFILYDASKNILFGARDRFGVKPLYYCHNRDVFVFASEIKALMAVPFVPRAINPPIAFEYLMLGTAEPLEKESFFAGIFELLPSHAFCYDISANNLKYWKYYTLEFTNEWEPFHEQQSEQYVAQIKDLVMKAVAFHLQSDVPVGCNLSGGVDSSSIVCVVNKLLQQQHFEQIGERQKVFTASYNIDAFDESKWAKLVIDHTNTTWHQTFPSAEELFQDLEDLVYTEDFPFGTTSVYAEHRVMKLARERGVTVLLGGQGGDELFNGYTPYYSAFFAEMLKEGAFGAFSHELRHLQNAPITVKWLLSKLPVHFLRNPLLRAMSIPFVGWSYAHGNPFLTSRGYCNRDFVSAMVSKVNWEKYRSANSMNMALHDYMTRSSLKYQLRSEDRNSMHFSIESRPVFSDALELIETMFQIPSSYKIYSGWSKYLLREAMKEIVPQKVLKRTDKMGFETPEQAWLGQLKDQLQCYFTSDVREYTNTKSLFHDWDRLAEPNSGISASKIWRCVNFAIWKNVYRL